MKHRFFFLFFLISMTVYGQQLECCQTVKEVMSNLTGLWVEKGSKHNIAYRYSFEDGKGLVEEYDASTKLEIAIEHDDSVVEVIKEHSGFTLKYTYYLGQHNSQLKALSSKKMTLVTEGKEIQYDKIEYP